MNNLKFLNHSMLFGLDTSLSVSKLYSNYLSLYNFFPRPPGVEYLSSRSMYIDLNGPWKQQPTEYPMPVMPASKITFSDAADSFGNEIINEIDLGRDIYLMWSGGIDSTAIAVSVLKYIKKHQHPHLHIISSQSSRNENPMFYHNFLSEFNQIDLRQFEPANLDLAHSIVLDGEGGDQIFGSSAANKIFSIYPEMILKPWRDNTDFLRQHWHRDDVPDFYDLFMNLMNITIGQSSVPVETLFDFYWWLNFNFKFDSVMFRNTLKIGENIPDQDFKYFTTQVCRRMFATEKMQQWSMSAGAEDKIYQARKTVKWSGKKYIYEFDKNEYYYREKRKEFSPDALADSVSKYLAIDCDYRRYGIGDRAVRQNIREKFYPNHVGKITMSCSPLWINK